MRVLVYGDSNSWGFLDDGLRQRCEKRWPVVMAEHSPGLVLIEECLSGRTTNLPDPVMGAYVDGSAPLLAILRSHQPIDRMLIMLGTNDLKARFDRSAHAIVDGLMVLSDEVSASEIWPADHPSGSVGSRLGFIAPPVLGARADDPNWPHAEEWREGRARSMALPDALEAACTARGHLFFDGNRGAASSDIDPIHWDVPTHEKMGRTVARWFAEAAAVKP